MKRILVVLFALVSLSASAKKIKFQVNMEAWLVDSAGVHITGDFQDEAGFAADWDPGTTGMQQDVNDTNIWWVVLDIPAFRHYEFKYVNGDQGYQQEFVPIESRVNYNFLDNRWIYLDSLSNDTQTVAAVRFSGNAPAGKNLVRFYVDMSNESVNSNGTHVATGFQSWNTTGDYMYSFDGSVYEYIAYVDSGLSVAREYKFLNGNAAANYEALAGWCANTNGNREVVAPRDTMLPVVCYTFCAACSTVGIEEISAANFSMVPNPAIDHLSFTFINADSRTVSVVDNLGREVRSMSSEGMNADMDVSGMARGVYYVRVMEASGRVQAQKLVIE